VCKLSNRTHQARWATSGALSLREVHDWSIALWVKPASDFTAADRQYYFNRMGGAQSAPGVDRMLNLRFIGTNEGAAAGDLGKTRFFVTPDGNSSGDGISSSYALPRNVWTHVCATYKAIGSGTSRMRLYLNGILDGQITNALCPIFFSTADLSIGQTTVTGSPHNFEGSLDEMVCVRRELTSRDAYWLYQIGKATHP
jgi:hypothetical protein